MSTWNASTQAYSDCEHCIGSGFTRDWEGKKTRCIVCLLTRIEELESVLTFYADENNYDGMYENDDFPISSKIDIDSGEKAREALGE